MKTYKMSFVRSRFVRFTAVNCFLSALVLLTYSTPAATLSWSGGSPTTGNWSDIQNWGFAGTPATGDTLIFPGAQPRLANVNDIASLTLSEIRFVGASGGYTISGNALTVTNGITATNTAGINAIANNITLVSVGLINVGSGASLTLSGALSGSVAVTKAGLGTLTYSGAANNTYSGTTVALEGTLELGKSGTAIPNTLDVGDATHSATVRWLTGNQIPNSSTVTLYNGSVLDVNNQLDDLGTLIMYAATVNMGTGYLDFRPPHTITLLSGTATINGRIGLPSGDVTVDVQSGSNPALNINASIGSAGGLIKAGLGGLSLNSSNGYGGLTVVQDGWLWIKNASGLGSSGSTNNGTVVSNGASLVLQGAFGVTNESLTLNGFGANSSWGAFDTESGFTNFWTGPITLNATSTIAPWSSSGVLRISGAISGAGGFMLGSQTGGGLGICYLEGTSANTYAGTTTVGGGTLLLGKTGGSGQAIPGDLIIGNNRTVRCLSDFQLYSNAKAVTVNTSGVFDLANFSEWIGPLTLNGGQVNSGTGLLYFSGDITVVRNTTAQSLISGNAQLWNGTYTITNTGHFFSPDLRFSANLSANSTYGVIKTGDGEVSLAGTNNTFGGPVTINQGTLWIERDTGLGNTTATATVNNGGTLFLDGNVAVGNKPLVLNGTGWAFGALLAGFGNSSWAGPVTLASDSVIDVYSGASLNLSGVINGSGALTKTDPGTLRFSGTLANTYAGATTVGGGALELNKSSGIAAIPGNLVINNGATARLMNYQQTANSADVLVNTGGLFEFATFYSYLDTLRGSGTVNFGVDGWIYIGLNNGSSTFDGQFTGIGLAGGWTVGTTGSGTFTMNGNNTFSAGNITIQGVGKTVINGAQPQAWVRILDSTTTLGGAGTVGIITAPGNISPGSSPGILTCSNLVFTSSGDYFVELNGPTPGPGYDQLNVRGTNNLAGATLHVSTGFTTPVGVGQQFTIINNDSTDPITGIFSGLAEGAAITSGGFGFTISYAGGSGNDVVLTLTNVPGAALGSLSGVTMGNGNAAIDPNECNYLTVVLTNSTGTPMTGISASLASITPGVIVSETTSPYPDVAGNGKGTNLAPFQISTTPSFVCGSDINLRLAVTTTSHGDFLVPVVVPSGSPAVLPSRYDVSTSTNIPDVGTIESTNIVAGFTGQVKKVGVAMWLTHAFDADLNISLISPDGVLVDLSSGNGAGANFGSSCSPDASRTTFDDAAGTAITAGSPPYIGTFQPEGSLATMIGGAANGNWRLRVQDTSGGTLGNLRCWSLFLYGSDCAPGSGLCELCPNVTITSATGPSSPLQAGYVIANGVSSTCGVAKACPGTQVNSPFPTENHTFRNGPTDACITVELQNIGISGGIAVAAYLGSFDPVNPDRCLNYLGDPGSYLSSGQTRAFSFNVASNAVFVVNVLGGSYGPYKLTVTGGDCRPALNIINAGAGNALLDWTTAAVGYQLESTNTLATGGSLIWPPVTTVPSVVNSRFQVTNAVTPADQFYRLRKPLP